MAAAGESDASNRRIADRRSPIAGERGSGVIGINGAAARLVHPGDVVILSGYAQLESAEAREHRPHVVFVDADNKILATGLDPAEAVPGSGVSGATPWPGASLP